MTVTHTKATYALNRDMPRPFKPAIKKHAKEIGEIAWAWNGLQAQFLSIFSMLVDKTTLTPGINIWHVVLSDKTQRDMLIAVAKARLPDDNPILQEILWTCSKAGELSGYRNAFVHAPIVYMAKGKGYTAVVNPFATQPTQARKFADRTFSATYKHLLSDLIALESYAGAIYFCARSPAHLDLPERPLLFILQDKGMSKARKTKRQKTSQGG